MPRTPSKHTVTFAPEYLAEMRARVERIGVSVVADAAGIARQTLWRQLATGTGRKPSIEGIERIRRALAEVAADEAMPPPLVEVRGRAHHAWIAIADRFTTSDLERVAEEPAAVAVAVKRAVRRK